VSDGEKALYDAITDPNATGTLEYVAKSDTVDFGQYGPDQGKPVGTNIVDSSDISLLRGADKSAAAHVTAHELLEAYSQAKNKSADYDRDDAYSKMFFPSWRKETNAQGITVVRLIPNDPAGPGRMSGYVQSVTLNTPERTVKLEIVRKFSGGVTPRTSEFSGDIPRHITSVKKVN
jgi:hypothetical protein